MNLTASTTPPCHLGLPIQYFFLFALEFVHEHNLRGGGQVQLTADTQGVSQTANNESQRAGELATRHPGDLRRPQGELPLDS